MKRAADNHAERLRQEIKGVRTDTVKLFAAGEAAGKALTSDVNSSKAEVLDRIQKMSAAHRGAMEEAFSALDERGASMHVEIKRALEAHKRLLKQVRLAAVFLAAAASGTLAILAYHIFR